MSAVVIYLLVYGAMNLGAFAIVIAVARRTRQRRDLVVRGSVRDVAGAGRHDDAVHGVARRCPAARRLVRQVRDVPVDHRGRHRLGRRARCASRRVNSVIAFFYYFGVVRKMWFDEPAEGDRTPIRVPPALAGAIALDGRGRRRDRRLPAAVRADRGAGVLAGTGRPTRSRASIRREGAITVRPVRRAGAVRARRRLLRDRATAPAAPGGDFVTSPEVGSLFGACVARALDRLLARAGRARSVRRDGGRRGQRPPRPRRAARAARVPRARCTTCSSSVRPRCARSSASGSSSSRPTRRSGPFARTSPGRRAGAGRGLGPGVRRRSTSCPALELDRRGDRQRAARQPAVRDRGVERRRRGSEVRIALDADRRVHRGARAGRSRRRRRARRDHRRHRRAGRLPACRSRAASTRGSRPAAACCGTARWSRSTTSTTRAACSSAARRRRAGCAPTGHTSEAVRRSTRRARRTSPPTSCASSCCTPRAASGFTLVGDQSQAEWLRGLGIDELVEAGRRTWEERAHIGDLEALAGRSRVGEASALTDPAGLGAHRVVTLSAA